MELEDQLSLKLKTNPFQPKSTFKKFLFKLKGNSLSYYNESGSVVASIEIDKGIFYFGLLSFLYFDLMTSLLLRY